MKVRFAAQAPAGSHALAVPLAAGAVSADKLPAGVSSWAALATRAAVTARFEGETGAVVELFLNEADAARRALLVGVGAEPDAAALERAGGALAAKLLTSGEVRLVIDVSGLAIDGAGAARIAFGAVLRAWRYDTYRTKLKPRQKPTLAEIVVVGAREGAEAAWAPLEKVAEGVFLTRELVTEPANIIYPESFVQRVTQSLEGLGVGIEVLGPEEMGKLGMNALLGVALGSRKPARLLCLTWKGSDADPIALVGKGVTFDTGGISIKPAAGMEDMKWDMGGAGAVAGAIRALAARKAKAHVIGVCGLVENMPDGNAQRPGDVVTSMSGQTIEVINTDAEGRLVLCDAITWVQRTKGVKTIVDLATLTGAMIISLGNEYGGLFSNDDALASKLLAAGEAAGERLWRFPLGEAYDKLINSDIADMKNVGPRNGGSITAAQFLHRYVEEGVKWAHLDIAGMVWSAKAGSLHEKGATGYGVRLLDDFVARNYER
ncbi:MAG: leucyl aminopeptidase [Sphingomonadaceae bacterium]|nr:leucyl aminopeptidase [Sphingomonadaceae bacterium]